MYSSLYIGSRELGAVRFISDGSGTTYIYDGSQRRIDALAISISYGAPGRAAAIAQVGGYDLAAFSNYSYSASPILSALNSYGYAVQASLRSGQPYVTNPSTGGSGIAQYNALVDRLNGGPISGLFVTGALLAGRSERAQIRAQALGAPLDGLAVAAVATRFNGAPTFGPTVTNPPLDGRFTVGRPSARSSEVDIGRTLIGQGYRPQISFLSQAEVNYGMPGSVRPEFYRSGSSVEVKNYNIETVRGRASLVRNVLSQVASRSINLPPNTTRSLYIDIRGQNVSRSVTDRLAIRLQSRSNGALSRNNVRFIR